MSFHEPAYNNGDSLWYIYIVSSLSTSGASLSLLVNILFRFEHLAPFFVGLTHCGYHGDDKYKNAGPLAPPTVGSTES